MTDQCAQNYARPVLRIGAYRFTRDVGGPRKGRWGVSAHGRGTEGHRTPLGALLALRRWLKVPARLQ